MLVSLYRKIRSQYRQRVGYPLSTRLVLGLLRRHPLFRNIRKEGASVYFDFGTLRGLAARVFPHSDLHVLKQVLLEKEYAAAVEFIEEQGLLNQPLYIIDAGANVGYTSAYFSHCFSKVHLLAVEPDSANYNLLVHNLRVATQQGQSLSPLRAALLGKAGIPVQIDRQAGDKKDWSFTITKSVGRADITSVSVTSLMQQYNWKQIDVLKIDIEGSEEAVFQEQADLSFLPYTRLIMVEIHDHMADRVRIKQLLTDHGFTCTDHSETTFAVNTKFSPYVR